MPERGRFQSQESNTNKITRAIVALSFLTPGFSLPIRSEANSIFPKDTILLIHDDRLERIQEKNEQLAEKLFNNPHTFVVTRFGEETVLPDDWESVPTIQFTSFADFQNAVASGQALEDAKAVVYDNEGWSRTPQAEQANPEEYTRLFSELAHEKNLLFIAAPFCDLLIPLGHEFKGLKSPNGLQNCIEEVITPAAYYADMLVLQMQWLEGSPLRYIHAVKKANKVAVGVNEDILTIAEVSTNPDISGSNSSVLFYDVINSLSYADGTWILISDTEKGFKRGIGLLHKIKAAKS